MTSLSQVAFGKSGTNQSPDRSIRQSVKLKIVGFPDESFSCYVPNDVQMELWSIPVQSSTKRPLNNILQLYFFILLNEDLKL